MEKSKIEEFPFQRIDQVGVIVRDIDQAVEYYSSLGIGPFETLNVTRFGREMYGKPVGDEVKSLVRIARLGGVQFELVQPVSGESIQKKFLETRGEGINHLGFFVNDFEKEVAGLVRKGFKVIQTHKYVGGGGIAYFDTGEIGGVLFELIQWPPNMRI